jgi:hypothetical protein
MVKKKVLVFHSQYADTYRELLEKGVPETELIVCRDPEEVEKWVSEIEIAFVPRNFLSACLRKCRIEMGPGHAAGLRIYRECGAIQEYLSVGLLSSEVHG